MNANELADKLQELDSKLHLIELFKSATMLRQQHAELDAFKLQYYNTGYSIQLRDKDETIRQQQAEIEALKKQEQKDYEVISDLLERNVKLKQTKQLSETRIKQIFVEQTGFYFDDNPADDLALMDFAKALLLEAQENG